MKKNKLIIILLMLILSTGCFKKSTMENAEIKVSAYPIEYVTEKLYGDHSEIKSIYPNDMDENYKVTEKLLKDYSKSDLFIFNGNEEKENDYFYKMLEENNNLKIIDATESINYEYSIEELWLDPMNLLTIANNIKKGFKEYTNITVLNNDIDEKYADLKVELIQIEADYRDMANRANNKTIVVGNDLFMYLEKYDINVISLEETDNLTQKDIYTAENLIRNNEIKVIYVKKGTKLNDNIQRLKDNYNIEIVELHPLYTISEEDRKNNKDYKIIMYENLELLKKQLYN